MALNRPLIGDLVAGVTASLATLAGWLTLAVLAFVVLGPDAAEYGIPAAAVTVSIGALIVALLGSSVLPSAGLSSATVLIFASIVGTLYAESTSVVTAMAGASCAVLLMGVLLALFGVLRLGSLAAHVPKPVLAGFMNGVAILAVLAQLPLLLGISNATWARGWTAALAEAQPATVLVGVATACLVWVIAWRFPRAPAALIALCLGSALYASIRALSPATPLGPLTGAIPTPLPRPDALVPLLAGGPAADVIVRHLETIGISGVLLAIVGALEITLNALATDEDTHTRHQPDRELVAFGVGNVACGVFGGLPAVFWRARAAALARSGGRSRWAAVAGAVATGLLYLLGAPLLALLPLTVLAGIMITVAWALADRWSRALVVRAASGERSRELWLNLTLVAVVLGVTVWRGFVAGVALGVLLAMALFIVAMNRSLVRSQYSAAARPSRRLYPRAQETFLQQARQQICVLELEGALFFGNADGLAAQVGQLDPACRFIVLDLKRISMLDASGAVALSQIAARLKRLGRIVLLAGVAPENRHGKTLHAAGVAAALQPDCFADADHAIEAAEHRLLAEAGLDVADADVALDECSLLQGMDPAQRECVRALLEPRELAAREILFRQGDAGDRLYVLTRGSVTVSSAAGDGRLLQRYVSFSPGMMLGETAMLDGAGRTADAIADVPSTVFALTRTALAQLLAEHPALAATLMANIARHLSERLRHAAAAWRLAAA